MNTRAMVTSAAAMTLLASASMADAAAPLSGASQMSIDISATVPVICRTQVVGNPITTAPGTIQLGALSEFCNNARGYRVVADYSPSLANAKLMVGGKPVPLNRSGSTVVSQSSEAAIASHDLTLEMPKGAAADGYLSFRIEPL